MRRDSIANTFCVAVCLCLVCSVVISTAAVALRPAQERNKALERKRNILLAAGLYAPEKSLEESFKQVETRIVDLRTGEFVPPAVVNPDGFNQREAARNPSVSRPIPTEADWAGIGRRENYSFVYLIHKEGRLTQIVLPIRGKGLWSTMYGFLALAADFNTIGGLTFYEHGETPGLGGEIDNPQWKKRWTGKRIADHEGHLRIHVARGAVDEAQPDWNHAVDGLAGATITSRGVSNTVRFWLSDEGFGKVFQRLRSLENAPAGKGDDERK
jgi:Na+-transporting NADH:ubiquinone oxidoreductase subunit C